MLEMDIHIKHKCPFGKRWDNGKAPCLNLSVVCEQGGHLSPSHSHPSASQPHFCFNLSYTTQPATPKSAVGSTRQSLTGNPTLESQNVSPKRQTGTELPLPSTATHSVLCMGSSVTAGQGSCIFLSPFMPASSPRSIVHSLISGIKIRPHCKCEKSHFTVIYAVDNMFWLQIDWIGGPTLNL